MQPERFPQNLGELHIALVDQAKLNVLIMFAKTAMARKIRVFPDDCYEFKFKETYRAKWKFLPNPARSIIACQLMYLEFHAWLKDNLKHSLPHEKWCDLVSDVAEGFHKTDILLYGAICEAAIHTMLYSIYHKDTVNAPDALKRCYEKTDDTYVSLHKAQFEMHSGNTPTIGSLCLRNSTTVPVSKSEVKFVNVIRAGKELGLYGASLRDRLDILRADRNSIHLAQHALRKSKGDFTRSDRLEAAKITEDLRGSLEAYAIANP